MRKSKIRGPLAKNAQEAKDAVIVPIVVRDVMAAAKAVVHAVTAVVAVETVARAVMVAAIVRPAAKVAVIVPRAAMAAATEAVVPPSRTTTMAPRQSSHLPS